jgi:hypothetical protein
MAQRLPVRTAGAAPPQGLDMPALSGTLTVLPPETMMVGAGGYDGWRALRKQFISQTHW